MIVELFEADRKKILPLIRNSLHQLSIQSVIEGNTPGEVYVDNRDDPRSGLIKTSECNMIFGDAANRGFNEGIKEHIDYFDQIICDEPSWDEVLPTIHGNSGLRKYRRKYYKIEKSQYAEIALDPPYTAEKPEIQLLYADTIGRHHRELFGDRLHLGEKYRDRHKDHRGFSETRLWKKSSRGNGRRILQERDKRNRLALREYEHRLDHNGGAMRLPLRTRI